MHNLFQHVEILNTPAIIVRSILYLIFCLKTSHQVLMDICALSRNRMILDAGMFQRFLSNTEARTCLLMTRIESFAPSISAIVLEILL